MRSLRPLLAILIGRIRTLGPNAVPSLAPPQIGPESVGKATVPLARYYDAFAAAVPVFGRGQVSTYILAGLGDTGEAILSVAERLVGLGVYPFVVPFVPISGTPLESHPAPSPDVMHAILQPLAALLARAGLRSGDVKAGCAKCGACSALSSYERPGVAA